MAAEHTNATDCSPERASAISLATEQTNQPIKLTMINNRGCGSSSAVPISAAIGMIKTAAIVCEMNVARIRVKMPTMATIGQISSPFTHE
jgi:hypothetical protein